MSGDDEQIVVPQNQQLKGGRRFIAGKTQLNIFKDKSAPLKKVDFTVMLQLSGTGTANDQSGVDIVAVLDVSGSMINDNKLIDMKTAMQFLINKLRGIDRLSIITFSNGASKLCPLRQMTPEFKVEAEKLVHGLNASGGTNMHDGLAEGINVLRTRRFTEGRTVGVILMSDGEQSSGFKDVVDVELYGTPVHTFGFGQNPDPKALEAVAAKVPGGTFSAVQQDTSLCMAFSTCLAGLLTVIVEDLKLTVTPIDATIKNVIAGNYTITASGDSKIVELGSLYSKEIRNILTDLHLPAVTKDEQAQVLRITFSYTVGGKLFESNTINVSVRRSGTSTLETENQDVKIEKARIRTSDSINQAHLLAKANQIRKAQEKLDEAQDFLENEFDDPAPPMIKSLKAEIKEYMNLLSEGDNYTTQAEAYARSSIISHGVQRHATRGKQELDTFGTPIMNTFKQQSKQYEKNPEVPPPSADKDFENERAADPLADIRGLLSGYIQEANQALKNIRDVLDNGL